MRTLTTVDFVASIAAVWIKVTPMLLLDAHRVIGTLKVIRSWARAIFVTIVTTVIFTIARELSVDAAAVFAQIQVVGTSFAVWKRKTPSATLCE